MSALVLILILLLLLGGGGGYYAYGPYGGIGIGGVILIVLIVLLLTGRLLMRGMCSKHSTLLPRASKRGSATSTSKTPVHYHQRSANPLTNRPALSVSSRGPTGAPCTSR